MTTQADFTASEWQQLEQSIGLVAGAINTADFTFFSFLKEVFVLTNYLDKAKSEYKDNELITSLLETVTKEDYKQQTENAKKVEVETFEEFIEAACQALREVVAIADKKATPQEAEGYRKFLYEVADKVANASGSGWFGTGVKVSKTESFVLDKFKTALGL